MRCKLHFKAVQINESDKDYPIAIYNDEESRYAKAGSFEIPSSTACVNYFKIESDMKEDQGYLITSNFPAAMVRSHYMGE